MDDRFQTRPYRHGWLLGFAGARNQIGHVDLETERTEVWTAPEARPLQEPCFISRAPGAPEGDGWIAVAATDAVTSLAKLNLLRATRIAEGPIATAKLPVHLKPAYHGNWVDGPLIQSYAASESP